MIKITDEHKLQLRLANKTFIEKLELLESAGMRLKEVAGGPEFILHKTAEYPKGRWRLYIQDHFVSLEERSRRCLFSKWKTVMRYHIFRDNGIISSRRLDSLVDAVIVALDTITAELEQEIIYTTIESVDQQEHFQQLLEDQDDEPVESIDSRFSGLEV